MENIQLTGYPKPVPIESIGWLKGDGNYTWLYFQNGTFTIVAQPLHWFEHHLNFVRVHRSAIVNPSYVREFGQKRGRSGWVRLLNNRVIVVSRARLDL